MKGLVSAADFVMLGVSHRSAPVEVRERCSVAPELVAARLQELTAHDALGESWLLSTCNRTEVLATAADLDAAARALEGALFGTLTGDDRQHVYRHDGIDAVFHLFRVASGLESQVLGETEILRQVKRATDLAREAGTCGRLLGPLLQQTLSVGKRVRSETRLGEGTLSVARAAVDLAKKVYGSFQRVTSLVVGAGETGMLVARHLKSEGASRLLFCNRTFERAERGASELGGEAVPFEELARGIGEANVVIVSVDAPEPILRTEHLAQARLKSRDRPLLLIDLSVPRAIDDAVREQRSVMVQTLDNLDVIVSRHREERQQQVDATHRILVNEAHKFLSLRTYDVLKPVVTGLVEDFEDVRRTILAASDGLSPEELSVKLTKRLLDAAFTRLKTGTRLTHSPDAISSEYKKYLERR